MKWYSSARNRAHVATIFFKTVANNNLREVDFHCIFLVTHQSNICENVVSNNKSVLRICSLYKWNDFVRRYCQINFFFLEACLVKINWAIRIYESVKKTQKKLFYFIWIVIVGGLYILITIKKEISTSSLLLQIC